MEYIRQNLVEILLIAGLLLLVIEAVVLGFSTFFLFFIGVGAISTGLIFHFEAIEASITNSLISVGLIGAVSAVVLWQPLQKMQESPEQKNVDNDMIGHQFQLEQDLTMGNSIDYSFSGINWKVTSDQDLVAGEKVEIILITVGKMKVQRVD